MVPIRSPEQSHTDSTAAMQNHSPSITPEARLEIARIAEGARRVCFEGTIDGMKWELKHFVQNVRKKWSAHTGDVPAHDIGLSVLDEVIRAFSKYDARFKEKYSIEEGGWGPDHPQWESWPHLRETKMPTPRLKDDSCKELSKLDFYGARRLTFLLDILEKVTPFIEAWQEQRTQQTSRDTHGKPLQGEKFTTSCNHLRQSIQAFDDVLAEPEGPLTPTHDPVYLDRCYTNSKGLELELGLPAAAWGIQTRIRKRPAPAAGECETPPSLSADQRSNKRQKRAMPELEEQGDDQGEVKSAQVIGERTASAGQRSRKRHSTIVPEPEQQKHRGSTGSPVASSHTHDMTNADGIDMFKLIRIKIQKSSTFYDPQKDAC